MEDNFKSIYEQFKIVGDTQTDSGISGKPLFDTNNITGQGKIKDIISHISNNINTAFLLRSKKTRALSDDINNTYDNINAIVKGSVKDHKNDRIDVTYYDIFIYDKKKKKKYAFKYADVVIPFEPIMNKIIYAMNKPDKNYSALKDVKTEVDEFLENYYWYVKRTEPTVRKNIENGPLGKQVKAIASMSSSIYHVLYNETQYINTELIYIMAVKKTYAECERKYSDDKGAMKIIDDIFMNCLKYAEDAINFNAIAADQLSQMLKAYEEELNKIYQSLK